MKTVSILYQEKPKASLNPKGQTEPIGMSQSNIIKNQQCHECAEYESLVFNLEARLKQSMKKEKKLKNMLDKLQAQNSSVVLNTDHAVKDFEGHIIKLQNQILQRDQIISRLADEIDNINNASDSLSQAVAEQRYKIKEIEQAHQAQLKHYANLNNELKLHIMRQISEKAAMERQFKEDARRWDIDSFKLKEQINSLNQQIQNKQKLIKSLSQSNNELRIEMIHLKNKLEIEDLTWTSSNKKHSWINDNQTTVKQLKNENQQLKIMNKGLQIELQFLVRETEEIETALVKIKLQRDILRKTVQKNNEKRRQYRQAGRIMHNSEIKSRGCWPGLIRFSKTAHTSIGSSVTNQITQECDSIDD